MVNYKLGKIYKIVSLNTNKIYIGSTTKQYLSQRMYHHVSGFKNNKRFNFSSYEILEYGDAKIILIEKFPCDSKDELRAREQYWIDKFKDICVNKHDAFSIDRKSIGRKYYHTHKENYKKYANEHKDQKRKAKKKYRENNKEKIYERASIKKLCIYCDTLTRRDDFSKHCKGKKHKENVEFFESI